MYGIHAPRIIKLIQLRDKLYHGIRCIEVIKQYFGMTKDLLYTGRVVVLGLVRMK